MHDFAQTNVQLYNQLSAAGRPAAELAAARAAYHEAQALFSARFRGSGKPFLCHLVGTASILAGAGAPIAEVVAGLLHAAYPDGEFGDGTRGASPAKRARLRAAVGGVAEALIAAYPELPWGDAVLAELSAGAPLPASPLLRLRLANELEDHLDQQTRYCRGGKYGSDPQVRLERCRALAADLGWMVLADALAAAAREYAGAAPAAALAGDRRGSYTLAPASHAPRLRLAWRYPVTARGLIVRGLARLRGRVRARVGRR